MQSHYIGYEAKLITMDREINTSNYKKVEILKISNINSKEPKIIKIVNTMINEFNNMNNNN